MLALSLLMVVSCAFCFACGDDPDEVVIPPRVHEANTNLKYFGYYHSDGYNSKSYFDEIEALDNSNIFLLNATNSPATMSNRLEDVRSRGYKAFITPVLFENMGTTVKWPGIANFIDGWQDAFINLVEGIREYIEDGTVYGIYYDEPIWNGIKESDFRECTKFMSEYFAEHFDNTGRGGEPVAIIHCMTVYDIGYGKAPGFKKIDKSTNDYCTDVAYDAYGAWNDAERNEMLWRTKWVSPDNAKIWGCATGALEGNTPELTNKLITSIEGMYEEAIWDPRYVGILMFTYPNGGDWTYGSKQFITPGSADYLYEVRKAQIDYGRKIIGKDPVDWDTVYELVLEEPADVYKVGDYFEVPASSAYNMGTREPLPYSIELTAPDTSTRTVESFDGVTLDQVGLYTLTLTAQMDGQDPGVKTVVVAVKDMDGEGVDVVADFEAEAYANEATGGDDDIWCWPRLVSKEMAHTGTGSLKVIPHSTDGDWMSIVFADGGNQVWDFSNVAKVSMWIYVTGDSAYENLSLYIAQPENTISRNTHIKNTQRIEPGVWTEIVLDLTNADQMYAEGCANRLAEIGRLIEAYETVETALETSQAAAEDALAILKKTASEGGYSDEVCSFVPFDITVENLIVNLNKLRLDKNSLEEIVANGCVFDYSQVKFAYGNVVARKRFDYPQSERSIFYIDDVTITYKD